MSSINHWIVGDRALHHESIRCVRVSVSILVWMCVALWTTVLLWLITCVCVSVCERALSWREKSREATVWVEWFSLFLCIFFIANSRTDSDPSKLWLFFFIITIFNIRTVAGFLACGGFCTPVRCFEGTTGHNTTLLSLTQARFLTTTCGAPPHPELTTEGENARLQKNKKK